MAEAQPNPSLAAGWVALEAGRTDDAVAAGEAALATFPHDHAAVVLVVSALTAGGRVPRAVTTYQGWAGNHPGGDIHLLAIVARGVLTTLGRDAPLLDQRVAALDVLSDCGDQAGPRALASIGPRGGARADAVLAEHGDEQAGQRLVQAASSGSGSRRIGALEALADARPGGSADVLRTATRDPDPVVRATAARLTPRLEDPQLVETLVPLLKDVSGDVRQSAALALVAAGRSEGDELVTQMLGTGIPDFVLAVAEALPNQPARWEAAVRGLLDTENPVDRLRAARLIAAVAPDDASRVVQRSLDDENPAVREEAARSLAAMRTSPSGDDLAPLLGDGDAWVRLRAAERVLRASTGQSVQSGVR